MQKLKKILDCLEKVKLEDIRIYDMKGRSPFYDYMMVATASSDRQAGAAMEYLQDASDEGNFEIRAVEGKNSTWELIDTYEVLIHIFQREERDYYDIDKLYMDVPQISLEDLE